MGTITINGQTFKGNNISITGNGIVIDGVRQDMQINGDAELRVIEGTINNLSTDRSVTCNDIAGNVSAGGSVSCDDVGGNVSAGGSVSCDDISGSVMAGGSISRRH